MNKCEKSADGRHKWKEKYYKGYTTYSCKCGEGFGSEDILDFLNTHAQPKAIPQDVREALKEKTLEKWNGGEEILLIGLEGDLMAVNIDDFINQPADGILYDLNRLEEITLSLFDTEHPYTNMTNFAVAKVIRRLKERQPEADNWTEVVLTPSDITVYDRALTEKEINDIAMGKKVHGGMPLPKPPAKDGE